MSGPPVAVLADVHGNLPALEAVLADVAVSGAELIVSAGDVVSGPMPAECLDRLAHCGCEVGWVMGNADRGTMAAFDALAAGTSPGNAHPIDSFAAESLSGEHRELLENFLPAVMVNEILICHGTPLSDEGVVTKRTAGERIAEAIRSAGTQTVVGGHVHHQFRADLPGGTWVNAGSVGMPYEGAPGAYWLLLTEDGPEFRRTTYDLPEAMQRIARTGYPAYDELARILRGDITADDAAEAFEHGL